MNFFSKISKNPSAKRRMVIFHHAGGSSLNYKSFAEHLDSDWELYGFDLPGRSHLPQEKMISTASQAFDQMIPSLQAICDRPSFLVGHSMGSLFAFEGAHALEQLSNSNIQLVTLSGFACPGETGAQLTVDAENADDDELIKYLNTAGGLPSEILERKDILKYYLPIIRSDLKLIQSYKGLGQKKIKSKIVACHGVEDVLVKQAQIQEWQKATYSDLTLKLFNGGHFHVFKDTPNFVNSLTRLWESINECK